MSNLKYQVKYISNTCSQTDELLNRPHLFVAESLFDLLKHHNEIQHPVIGLEGSWGSGKSQVISILQKLIEDQGLSKKYKFITYDVWSAQEDLTRSSFLDSVLNDVKRDESHFHTEQLNKDYKELHSTKTIRSIQSFPLVRLCFASILLIPLMIFIVNSIELAWGYNEKAILTYDQLKGGLSLFFSLLASFLFVQAYREERKSVSADSLFDNMGGWEKFQVIIGRLFYIYKAKDVQNTDYETVLKDEPSISRFQNFFDHIHNNLKEDSVLVIVFDNMDRLSDSHKLMSTWSLLHTFFAEKQYKGKVWALVPYDKMQLANLMNGDDLTISQMENGSEPMKRDIIDRTTEFINKTFFTTFRIPEPIMGSWKNFLSDKLDQAFSPHLDDEDKNYVTLIFSRSMARNTIRPRDIIAYVNRLISIYLQHHFEDVPMRFIALYAQYESSITSKPFDSILNFVGLEAMVPLVGKDSLSRWLSSIYYNLPSETALEVVYDREIQIFLQCDYEIIDGKDEALEAYQSLSSNELFHHHIEDFFNKDVDLKELKIENVFYLLEQDNISQGTRNQIYNTISDQLVGLKDQLMQYEPWMEYAFLHYDIQNTNKIIKAVLLYAKANFETHYKTVIPLLQIQKKRSDIQIFFDSFKAESVIDMIDFYDYLVEEHAESFFKKSKIYIESVKLLDFMKEGVSGNMLLGSNTDKVYGLLRLMKNAKCDLKPIEEAICSANINLASQEHSQVERIYRTYNIVTEDKWNIPNYTLFDSNGKKFLDIPEYLACTLVQQKNMGNNKNHINNCLSTELVADKDSVNEIFPTFFTYDYLIMITLQSGNTMLKQICNVLAESQRCSIQNADELIYSTSRIIDEIFEGNSDVLLSFLDSKSIEFRDKKTIQFVDADEFWRNSITKENIVNHPVYKTVSEMWLSELKDVNWDDVFETDDRKDALIILKLNDLGIIDKQFWKSIPVDTVCKSFEEAVVSNTSFNFSLFNGWKQNVSKATLAKLANDTKYAIVNPKNVKSSHFVYFVELFWEYSELIKSQSHIDAFYDDFISEYFSKTSAEHIGEFLHNHLSQVNTLASLLSNDRKELFVDNIQTLLSQIPNGSMAANSLEELVGKYKGKTNNHDKE